MTANTWDPHWVARLLGATMIVSRPRLAEDGTETQEEFWGVVWNVSPTEGVTLALRGQYSGQNWPLPAGPEALSAAPAGPHILAHTGDRVEHADFLARLPAKAA